MQKTADELDGNQSYLTLNGPTEFDVIGPLRDWDRTADLAKIEVPTLVIGARHDTMDPEYMAMMASKFPRGTYLYCPNGSHLAIYDDQATWFGGVLDFIREVEGAPDK